MKLLTRITFMILFSLLAVLHVNGKFLDANHVPDTLSPEKPVKELFTSHEVLNITIKFQDLENLKKDVGENPSWHRATLIYNDSDQTPVSMDIKVQARGIFRKDPSNCSFPPLRVNFKKNQVNHTVFSGQDKIKLVTHCRSNFDEYNQYVLKEYLAYRIYNIMTEKSFKVRLAKITYIDEGGEYKTITRNAFFIEDTKDMASRNGFRHVKVKNIPQEYVDFFYQDLLAVFQYMIGNTDWSVPSRHNIKILLDKPDSHPIAVPYDFDWSGLVNPVYAKPSPKLGISSVKERLFRGFEKNPEDYQQIFDLFMNKKEEIYSLIEECGINERQCRITKKYLDDFYEIINDEKKIMREFITKARDPNDDYWGK